jgi:hypothetical protein
MYQWTIPARLRHMHGVYVLLYACMYVNQAYVNVCMCTYVCMHQCRAQNKFLSERLYLSSLKKHDKHWMMGFVQVLVSRTYMH